MTLAATCKVWVAVPPARLAAVKLPRLKPAGQVAVGVALVTMLSGSVAVVLSNAAVPAATLAAGQVATMGRLPEVAHRLAGLAELRGAAVATVKSAALLLVSVQPPALRCAEVVVTLSKPVGLPSDVVAAP